MKVLSQMRLWQKLAVLVVAMAVPTALVGTFYLSDSNEEVRQARSELQGARYAEAVGSVFTHVVSHRGRANTVLNGDESKRAAMAEAAAEIDQAIAAADLIDAELGRSLRTMDAWQAVKTEWNSLKPRTGSLSPDESMQAHNSLLTRISNLIQLITANSGMNVDPLEQTSVLVTAASREIPDALVNAGNLRRHAVRAAIAGYLGGDDRKAIEIYNDMTLENLAQVSRDLERVSEGAKTRVRPAFESAQRAYDGLFQTVQQKILSAQSFEITGAQVYDAGAPAIDALRNLSTISYQVMNDEIAARLSNAVATRNFTAAVAALALGVALLLAWLITRAMTRPLEQAISVFGAISSGKYDNEVDTSGTDETAQVLGALADMQGKLSAQIETERAQAAENSRIRQALDKVSTNVVLADAHHQIIYLNDTAGATFARSQQEIRKALPGFDASHLKGSSLDALSAEPAQQRRMLETLTGSDTQDRVLGGCTFRVVANPVVSDQGERIGTVLEWTDRTQEVAVEKEMQSMLSAVIGGDLGQRIAMSGKAGFFEAMSRGVNQLADNMTEIVAKVKAAASEVYRGAEEISAGNANLSQRTEEQSSSLEETASSMEEMTSTVKQNADNAGQANQLAIAARDQAEKGGAVVGKAVHAMTGINDASRKIADIIGVIDEIAFQTNLLALNAAVEAARAGEQGRGFAVVASEVRSLAGRSATAAKEIKELIQDSVRKVEDGSMLVTESGQTLEQIVSSVKKVSDIVAEIAAASREQSSGIEQVNRAVTQMDELTQQNAALVEEATAASQAMADQARALNEMMSRYLISEAQQAAAATLTPATRSDSSATASAGPGVERRSARRPWAGRSKGQAPASGTPAAAPPARKAAAASNGSDAEWQEF